VKRRGISRKAPESLEQFEDPLSRQPVGDREQGGPTPLAEIRQWTFWRQCHVPPGGHDSNPRSCEPSFDELLREMVARGNEEVGSPQCQPIQRRLGRRASSTVVDAAWRLMKNGDDWNALASDRERRTGKRSGDRVDEDGTRLELLRTAKHCGAAECGEWERPLRKGQENDPRPVRRCLLRHPQVVQVPATQPTGIA
jgi:hypothetical protein